MIAEVDFLYAGIACYMTNCVAYKSLAG